jgi:hypothetical protein
LHIQVTLEKYRPVFLPNNNRSEIGHYPRLQLEAVQGGRQILAGGSLLRSGQTQVGEPKIDEHAQ